MVVALTTFTCTAEMLSWKEISQAQKMTLASMYVPYLALATFMGLDMFLRLEKRLSGGRTLGEAPAKKKAI